MPVMSVAIVGRAIRKPSLNLHACFRTSIDYRAHSNMLEALAAHKLIQRNTRSRSSPRGGDLIPTFSLG
jgi:hypothetical protein